MTQELKDTPLEETLRDNFHKQKTAINQRAARQDLFKNKEEMLEEFCRQQGFFSSHDVNYYGTTHFYDSATRRIREWVREGRVKHLNKDEALFRGFKTKCAVYEFVR